jgi:hypothetical protein
MDLGRGPTPAMMERIRREVAERAGVKHLLISGSHTHHGPVIELTDQEGRGKGRFDPAVAYAKALPELLTEAIVEASNGVKPARLGVASAAVTLNRNRQTKKTPAPTDPTLTVVRIVGQDGRPVAVLVNFAAHPVLTDGKVLKFSADYPGFLQKRVEEELGGRCVFLQGASGDLSPNPGPGQGGPSAFGAALGDEAVRLARSVRTEAPARASILSKVDRFRFVPRIDLGNPLTSLVYERAFFPELVRNYVQEFKDGVNAELTTVLLNGEIGLVGVSGEFFCNHANRLRERAGLKDLLFVGYCNGHAMYFPTIEAAAEGGYGADPAMSPAALGAGEEVMNRALVNLFTMRGNYPERRGRADGPG